MAKQKFKFNTYIDNESSSADTAVALTEQPDEIKQIVKQLDTPRESVPMEIKLIPRQKICTNEKNHYPINTIEELAKSILHYKLQQPITVVYVIAEDKYLIEAGHQRTLSLDFLINKYKDYPNTADPDYQLYTANVSMYERGYPCIIQAKLDDAIDLDKYYSDDLANTPESVIDSEIRLIITNEIKRTDDPAVKAQNIARLSTLYEYRNQGKSRSDKININKQIADDLNITERQVINYKKLDKLIPDLKAEFDNHNLSLKNSTLIAKLDIEDQEKLLQLIRAGETVNTDEITTLLQEKNALTDLLRAKDDLIEQMQKHQEDNNSSSSEQELSLLKLELAKLKQNKPTDILLAKDTQLIKLEMSLKTSLAAASTALNALSSQVQEYCSVTSSELASLHLTEKVVITEKCSLLKDMLQTMITRSGEPGSPEPEN